MDDMRGSLKFIIQHLKCSNYAAAAAAAADDDDDDADVLSLCARITN
jgi:hypothetical protein